MADTLTTVKLRSSNTFRNVAREPYRNNAILCAMDHESWHRDMRE